MLTDGGWHSLFFFLHAGDTRFASNYIMLERVQKVFKDLQRTVLDDRWTGWVNRQKADTKSKAADTKGNIMSRQHYKRVKELVQLLDPVVGLLRLMDGTKPTAGKVYWRFFQLCEGFKNAKLDALLDGDEGKIAEVRAWLHTATESRWNMVHTDIHACAYVLDPEFWHHTDHSDEAGLMAVCCCSFT